MGYNPVDFWRTHPTEYFWTLEAKIEQQKPREDVARYAGGMTKTEVEAIYNEAYGDG